MSDAAGGESPEKPENRGDSQTGEAGSGDLFAAAARGLAARGASPVVDADEAGIERRFGRGRPKGATNIATKKRQEMFARIAGDQMLASARILAMPLAELAAMLDCKIIAAAEFQQRERFNVMPYVASKQPLAVQMTGRVANLHLNVPAAIGNDGQPLVGSDAMRAMFEAAEREAIAHGFGGAEAAEDLALIESVENADETEA